MSKEIFNDQRFPKVYAWVARFNNAFQTAKAAAPKPTALKGADALRRIGEAALAENVLTVDKRDPLHLEAGDEVEVWPTDSGFGHKDRGRLLKLSINEVVIAVKAENGQEVHLHTPRNNFRIAAVKSASRL